MKHHHSVCAARAIPVRLVFGPSALADFYVSPSGSDAGAGTVASPFASLEKGRDAVRAAKQSSPTRGGDWAMFIGGGRDHRVEKQIGIRPNPDRARLAQFE